MRYRLTLMAMVVVGMVWSSSAEANKWRKTRVWNNKALVSIDRQHQQHNTGNTKPTISHSATGYVNLVAASLSPKARATVTITSYPSYNGYEYGSAETVKVQLAPSQSPLYGAHLSGKMPKISTGISGYGGNQIFRQKIEVWLTRDGKNWEHIKDPVPNPTGGNFQTWFGL